MKRIRTMGLLMVALCAMSAVTASAASAVVFTPNNTKAVVEGKNAQFTAPNKGLVECEVTSSAGETQKESATLIATSVTAFKTCTAFGVKATVAEKCSAGFGTIVATSITAVTINLVKGCEVVVTTSTCKLTATGAQSLAGTFTNGTPSKIVISKAAVNVTTSPETGICGKSGAGTESGTFTISNGVMLK